MIVQFIFICYLFCVNVATATTAGSNTGLTTITECLCPGYHVIYECTVTGGVFTVWGGSAFQCAGNEIILSNSGFGSVPPPAAVCNNGHIIGLGISQQNNCYTSQLNVTLSEGLIGRTVTCGIDDGTQLTVVDSIELTTSNRSLSPPMNITVNITSNRITFEWDHVLRNCPGLYYSITSVSCGRCPNETDMSMISCSNFVIPTNCTLMIRTVTCWRTNVEISGNSTSLSLFLKFPEAPDLTVVPYYNENDNLIGIYTNFSKNRFMISDSVDGSPIFYNVTYTDFSGGTTCGSAMISTNSASCNTETCIHNFSNICSSTDIMVTVFGTNALGSGASNRTTVDHRNEFVKIGGFTEFTSSRKEVKCTFREQTSNVAITCRISIATGSGCQSLRGSKVGARNSMDTVTVTINLEDLIDNMDDGKELCYNITASNGIKQVVIRDIVTVSVITDSGSTNAAAIAVPIFFFLTITVTVVAVIIIVYMILKAKSETRNISDDCKPLLLEEGESLLMDECGKRLVGKSYDHSLGQGYYLADANEQVPSDANIIARSEDGDQYKTGSGVRKKLIKNGTVLTPTRRGSEYETYSIYVQSRSREKQLKSNEFVYCKVIINDCLQEKDLSTLPAGVVALKKWYYMYDIPHNMPLKDFCKNIGKLPDIDTNLFYEKYARSEEHQGLIGPSKVMALRANDHRLFEDRLKILYREATPTDTKKISDWEHLFIRLPGVKVIHGGSKLLYCDQKHGPDLVCKKFEIFEVTTDDKDKNISELLKKSHPFVQFELKMGSIYMETEETIKPQDKLMALDNDWKLCTGPGVHQLLSDIDRQKIWKSIFVQVTTDKSLQHCKSVLYCKT